MEKEFIPYEQALALKELGFDEYCFAIFNLGLSEFETANIGQIRLFSSIFKINDKQSNTSYVNNKDISKVTAPLYQQAFRWFREKYDLVIEPCVPFQRLYSTEEDHFEILEFGYRIYSFDQYRGGLRDKIEWDGYDNSNEEEAELECLKKLIEIVKDGK